MKIEGLTADELEREIQFLITSSKDDAKKYKEKFNRREAALGDNWSEYYDNVFI